MGRDSEQFGEGAQTEGPNGAEHRVTRATSEGVDAQNATEFDMRNGIAGEEAKPFAKAPGHPPAPPEVATEPDRPTGEQQNLISGRRNAGREDGAENQGQSRAFSDQVESPAVSENATDQET